MLDIYYQLSYVEPCDMHINTEPLNRDVSKNVYYAYIAVVRTIIHIFWNSVIRVLIA